MGRFSIYVNNLWQTGPMPKALPVMDISDPVCCSPVAAGPIGDDAALEIALRLKALADPARVKLVSLLFSSPDEELCSGLQQLFASVLHAVLPAG